MKIREFIKSIVANKVFWAVLLLPFLVQAIFLFLLVPALNGGSESIKNLQIAIVNDDKGLGTTVSQTMAQKLPFKAVTYGSLDEALAQMNDGIVSAVFYIPSDFSAGLSSGGAEISYHINQAAPTLTKQMMESLVKEINTQINQMAFAQKKAAVESGLTTALSSAPLPPEALSAIGDKISTALSSMTYETVQGTIVKVNASDGFIQMFLSMFIFIAFFLSAVSAAVASGFVFDKLRPSFSKWAVLGGKIAAILLAGCLVPLAFILTAACYDIPVAFDTGRLWFFLFMSFSALSLFILMFIYLFSVKGLPPVVLVLLPLQLVTCAIIFPKEILPGFYSWLRPLLPSTFIGSGLIKSLFGGASVSTEIGSLLLISLVCLAIIVLTTALKWRKTKMIVH